MSRTIVIDLFNGQGYSDSTAFEVNAWNDGIEQAQEIVDAQRAFDEELLTVITSDDDSVSTEWSADEIDWGRVTVTEAKADVIGVMLMPDTLDYMLLDEKKFKWAYDITKQTIHGLELENFDEELDGHTDGLGYVKIIKL